VAVKTIGLHTTGEEFMAKFDAFTLALVIAYAAVVRALAKI